METPFNYRKKKRKVNDNYKHGFKRDSQYESQ